MNAKTQSLLNNFPAALEKATTNEEIKQAVVELENAVLKSNLDENSDAPVVARDYVVGEANTRGLSWKLNLLRAVAAANFCQLMRIGVHGGNTRVLGQEDNLNITFAVYDALVAKYEEASAKAFQDFSDAQSKDENAEKVHRVGWTGKYLIDSPTEVFEAVMQAREENSNAKVTAMVERKNEALGQLRATFTPTRTPAAPKAKKSKAPKDGESNETPEGEGVQGQEIADMGLIAQEEVGSASEG